MPATYTLSNVIPLYNNYEAIRSKIVVIFLEVLETHLVLVDLRVFEAILDLVEGYLAADCLEHRHHVLWDQVALSGVMWEVLVAIEMVE